MNGEGAREDGKILRRKERGKDKGEKRVRLKERVKEGEKGKEVRNKRVKEILGLRRDGREKLQVTKVLRANGRREVGATIKKDRVKRRF